MREREKWTYNRNAKVTIRGLQKDEYKGSWGKRNSLKENGQHYQELLRHSYKKLTTGIISNMEVFDDLEKD